MLALLPVLFLLAGPDTDLEANAGARSAPNPSTSQGADGCLRVERGEGVLEAVFDVGLVLFGGDFLFVPGGDVEGVHGGAFLGEDFGEGNVEAKVGEGAGDVIEEADAVFGFDVEDGAVL